MTMSHGADEHTRDLSPRRNSVTAELFAIPLDDGGFIVYAPLRRAAFVANARMVDLIAGLRDTGGIPAADDPDGRVVELLRNLEIVDGGEERAPTTEYSGEPEPTTVTLFLTTACNLRCSYCYAAAGDRPARFMSLDVATRGIDFVIANARRLGRPDITITYHGGGEPSVNWTVMTGSLAYARQVASRAGLTVRAYAATNGVMSQSQADWMIQHLDGVSVSCDGLPSAHDRNRLTVLGQGSSPFVARTLRRFDAASFPYGVRVTVTADQIPALPGSVHYLCSTFHPARIQVEPAYQLGRWADAPSAETEQFIEAFREAQNVAGQYGQTLLYSAARVGTLTSHFCGTTQDLFALSPDGNVSGCFEVFSEESPHHESFFYGRPDDALGYRFNLSVLNHLRHQTVEHRECCSGCFAKWTCAGDCYHKAVTIGGSSSFAGTDRCHITRELTKDQLLHRIAQSGGLFWHEGTPSTSAATAGKELLP